MASPFPFVAGNVLTAAQLNSIGEAWTSYTPVIKGGATTVTATIQYAKYAQVNKILFVHVEATVTSTGAANGSISVTLPIQPTGSPGSRSAFGSFLVLKSSVAFYTGVASIFGTPALCYGTAYNSVDNMGAATPALTLQNGDQISFSVCYEVA
jgi:hypothetical protein